MSNYESTNQAHCESAAKVDLDDISVSVLVPAYNEQDNITNLLRSILEQDIRPAKLLEILVDASGSNDNSRDLILEMSKAYQIVSLVDIGKRDGLVASLDRLLKRARGDLIVRIDGDVRLPPLTLFPLIGRFTDRDVGIVGPRVRVNVTNNRIVNRIVNAEYELHHLVSQRKPKTTNLQVFRRLDLTIIGSEAEDNLIQHYIVSTGFKALYDDSVYVVINPPCNVSDLFKQRARCIRTTRWFKKQMNGTSSTQSLGCVLPAIVSGLRNKGIVLTDLLMFLTLETITQAYVFISETLFGHRKTITWEKLSTVTNKDKRDSAPVTFQHK